RSQVTFPRAGDMGSVIVSRDGRWVVAGPAFGLQNRLLGFRCDADGILPHTWTWDIAAHSQYELLCGFVGTGDQFVTVGSHLLSIRDAATGEVRSTVAYPSAYSQNPVTSPDGGRLAVMGYNKLYLWNTNPWGKPKRVECGGGRRFTSLAFHPTRPILAAIQGG